MFLIILQLVILSLGITVDSKMVSLEERKVNIALATPSKIVVNRENPLDLKFGLKFDNEFFLSLYKVHKMYPNLSFVSLINTQLEWVQLIKTDRLEERFRTECSKVSSEYRQKVKKSGSTWKKEFKARRHNIGILQSEAVNAHQRSIELDEFKENLAAKEAEIADLYAQLAEFRKVTEHDGNLYEDYQSTTQGRLRAEIAEKAKAMLFFAQSYGITPKILEFTTNHSNQSFKVNLEHNYEDITDEEKKKLRTLVYLMEKFGISDSTTHEIRMEFGNLPPKHMIVTERNNIDANFTIERIPGGAMVNVKDEVRRMLPLNDDENTELKLKISGDGTRVSRISQFITFMLSKPCVDNQSSLNQHALAIIKGPEEYQTLMGFSKLFAQIHEIMEDGQVDGRKVDLYLGADMKMVLALLGLNAANGTYSCPWCKIKSDDRYRDLEHIFSCHEQEMLRDINEMISAPDGFLGKKEQPLININVLKIIPDILHLLLRITDLLEGNLFDETVERDNTAKVRGQVGGFTDKLVALIQKIVPSFEMWDTKDGHGREYAWSSMNGNDKYKVLSELPSLLREQDILHSETEAMVLEVWEKFKDVYDEINGQSPSYTDAYKKACEFKSSFLKLAPLRKGYKKTKVTPYVHTLEAHVPYFIKEHGNLKQFSGQPTEKVMDDMKKIHQKASQKLDAAREALVVRKRIELLHNEGCQRKPRKYEKKDKKWWGEGIRQTRRRKMAQIQAERVELHINPEDLSEPKLRLLLKKKFGISTKIRSKRKLVDMVNKAMEGNAT